MRRCASLRSAFLVMAVFLSVSRPSGCQTRDEPPVPQPTDLAEVMELARRNCSSLKQVHLQALRAGEQVSSARTRLNPRVGTYLLGAHQLEDPKVHIEKGLLGRLPMLGVFPPAPMTLVGEKRDSVYSLVNIVQPITQLSDIRTGVRMAETAREITVQTERQVLLDVLCETKKLFCSILAVENARRANSAATVLFRELSKNLERLVGEGYAQKADLLNVEARLAQTEAREEALRLKRISLGETLNRVCGNPPEAPVLLASLPEPLTEPGSGETSPEFDPRDHPVFRRSELQENLARFDEKLKRSEFKPQIIFSVNRLQAHKAADYIPKSLSSAELLVSWYPFDWGRRKHDLESARLAREQARIASDEVERTLHEAVRAAGRRCRETLSALKAAREKCSWASEQARVFRNRLQERTVLPKDLLEVEAQLAEADFQMSQACLDVWIARAEFEKAAGVEE